MNLPQRVAADLAAVWDALPGARIVGGAVRDTLAGRPVADIDLATPLPPEAVGRALGDAGLRAIPTGIEHGTVTALSGASTFEVTTLRRDVATDGRHATVVFTEDWREDAARRDFTFNALSMSRDGTLHDFFDGQADLRAGKVRFVGDPASRIAEDFLRVLRFFRFQARYGQMAPDRATAAALREGVPGLAQLSPERVWSEIKRILAAPDPDSSLMLMGELGVLHAVLPELASSPAPVADLPPDAILRLASLQPRNPDTLAARLRLSTGERDRLLALGEVPPPPDLSDADLRRALADTDAQMLADRARLARQPGAAIARLLNAPKPAFPLRGRDLLALGVAPGPAIGVRLQEMRSWWMAGGCTADADATAAELARRMTR